MQRKTEEEKQALLDKATKEDLIIGQALCTNEKAIEILELLFYDRPSYVKGDPYDTCYREGQRDVVGYLRECVKLYKKRGEQLDGTK